MRGLEILGQGGGWGIACMEASSPSRKTSTNESSWLARNRRKEDSLTNRKEVNKADDWLEGKSSVRKLLKEGDVKDVFSRLKLGGEEKTPRIVRKRKPEKRKAFFDNHLD